MMFGARLKTNWEAVASSYWFVPSVMATAAAALAFGMVRLDGLVPHDRLSEAGWFYTGTADGARGLLTAIASSMIGVAGVVFSITIVALTLASNQFGPRLLRNFMADKGNQITLGTFLAAFLYSLLVLRDVRGEEGSGGVFVPQLSLFVAVLLAVASIGVLIYYIHHAAASIQAPNVVAAVARELAAAIDSLFPERLGQAGPAEADFPLPPEREGAVVATDRGGYLLRIEEGALLTRARESDLLVKIERRPGQYVESGDAVLRVWPRGKVTDDLLESLTGTFAVGDQRSLAQDAEFPVEQLVEIAARALSPGINDPFTAIQVVDRLGEALGVLSRRAFPSPVRADDAGLPRVVAYPSRFGDFLDVAFNQIRQYAANQPDVLLAMLEVCTRIARHVCREADGRDLAEHAEMIYDRAIAAVHEIGGDRDRRKIEARYGAFRAALQNTGRSEEAAAPPASSTVACPTD